MGGWLLWFLAFLGELRGRVLLVKVNHILAQDYWLKDIALPLCRVSYLLEISHIVFFIVVLFFLSLLLKFS